MIHLPNLDARGYNFGNGEPWTPSEIITLEVLSRTRLTRPQAAALIGRAPNQVSGACRRYGIRFPQRHAATDLSL